jgi:hypothetical protein
MASVNILLTVGANNQCFPPSLGHSFHPPWLLSPPFFLEIGQLANVMDFYVRARTTEFTCLRKKSFDEFIAVMASPLGVDWIEISDDCLFLPSQWYASELCYQGLLSVFSLNNYL